MDENRVSSERLKQLMQLAESKRGASSDGNILHSIPEPVRSSIPSSDNEQPNIPTVQEETKEDATSSILTTKPERILGVARDDLILNAKQEEAVTKGVNGEDFVLIGRAGTGKTTTMRYLAKALIEKQVIPAQLGRSTKYLNADSPGVAVLSFTNKAVNNIRHAMPEEFKRHTLTIHKILEFAPVRYEVFDEVKGDYVTKMKFEPKRNAFNPLPSNLKLIVFEESSMISVELFNQLISACPHKPQLIFLGDIRQLPPVFGTAILGFKMLELPIVELSEVYRQALKSPILRFALAVDDGDFKQFDRKMIQVDGKKKTFPELEKWNESSEDGILLIHPWQKPISADHALMTICKFFEQRHKANIWNCQEDMILCPFNKAFGTIEINKGLMQFLGEERKAPVFEVIAGFVKHYLAVGDRVLFMKEDAIITNIAYNTEYLGKRPRPASVNMDRWGHMRHAMTEEEKKNLSKEEQEAGFDVDAIEKFLAAAADDVEERVTSASHIITVKLKYDPEGEEQELESASEINNLLGGYAITVHKAQGSEWDNVYLLMHNSHAVMNQRELLYTAITRAKKMLYFICEPDTLMKGIQSQKIKGNSLEEKAEWFKGKKEEMDKKLFEAPEVIEGAESREGVYAGEKEKKAIVLPPEPKTPPVPLIKLHEFVSQAIKNDAQEHLNKYWYKAKCIWGDKIGERPQLDFNLQRAKIIGLAQLQAGVIKLNPVWSILAGSDLRIREEMFSRTMIHEICHIVSYRYSYDRGHGSGWHMAMKLMGEIPDIVYNDNTLPAWTNGFQEVMKQKMQELQNANADFIEDDSTTEDEEI